ncbi:MAG: fused MFS/spermidine synthase [Nitriliruptoraceae bacterium]|nr:fused MFS/spermidine synthase [Nitriliruptoraceae bacterium]
MHRLAAAALVFLSSAAVLVLEILAARLLAPYVGNTLETYTAIIGVVLAGIAAGSWLGGKAADIRDPKGLLAPLLIVGGALSFAAIPIIDGLGVSLRGAGAATTTIITTMAFFAPAAVLSAVTPAVIKIQLESLEETGRVVGRLSALSTTGAIVGTFLTGFLLVAAFPTRPVIRVVAVLLIVMGLVTALAFRRQRTVTLGGAAAVLAAGLFSFAAAHPCEQETAYYCAYIVEDEERESGRALWLDTLRHSYVDLEDPSYLEFTYTRWFGDVIAGIAPEGEPLSTLHIGGAGFTMPRYLRAEHPGSFSEVLEVDGLLVELAERELGLELRDDIEVRVGDARTTIDDGASDVHDLVIGDAFGGVAVPWHLATREFTELIRTRMTDDGVYTLNAIDYGPRRFLRAEIATLDAVFEHVAVLGRRGSFDRQARGDVGGNYVLIASDAPLPLDAIEAANRRRGADDELLHGPALDDFVGDAEVLVDDHAPVDQLLTPRPSLRAGS